MFVIGIDPGNTGALASINMVTHKAEAIEVPLLGKEIDARELALRLGMVLQQAGKEKVLIYIERVHAFHKSSATSAFSFGQAYGILKGVLTVLGMYSDLSIEYVTPQAWKKVVLAGTAKDKDAAVLFVRNKYPEVDLLPGEKKKPHDGIADAVCIAHYGVLKEKKDDR